MRSVPRQLASILLSAAMASTVLVSGCAVHARVYDRTTTTTTDGMVTRRCTTASGKTKHTGTIRISISVALPIRKSTGLGVTITPTSISSWQEVFLRWMQRPGQFIWNPGCRPISDSGRPHPSANFPAGGPSKRRFCSCRLGGIPRTPTSSHQPKVNGQPEGRPFPSLNSFSAYFFR